MRKIALISNPGAGSAEEIDVAARLESSGAEIQRFEVGDTMEAGLAGADRIVVAGGDGSIAPAAEVAAREGREFAVIAAGTANDFADRMGLPADIGEAAMLAATGGRVRTVDLARVGGRPFVNVASLGLAPAAANAAEDLKGSLGALAYSAGALQAAASEEPLACSVACDGEPLFEGEAWQVMVGCTGAFGGGSRIDAEADDGRLDVVVIAGGPRAELAKRAIGLRAGRLEEQDGVVSARCADITVRLETLADLNVDGEVVPALEMGGPSLAFSVEPRAVRLVVG